MGREVRAGKRFLQEIEREERTRTYHYALFPNDFLSYSCLGDSIAFIHEIHSGFFEKSR